MKENFITELDILKSVLQCEINLYTAKDSASINLVEYLSNRRLNAQKEFLTFDNDFKQLLKRELHK